MIPIKQEYESQGNLFGQQQVDMSIDQEGIAHIIGLLADLYKDSELAVIRELSTNARDANIAAGVDKPIEITLPNYWNNNFIVKDHGVGLSVDELAGFYSKVGASTKRESNEVTGFMGIGRISPLPYAGTFTVTAIQNGVKSIVLVKYNGEGVPVVEIIDTASTDEPNGLEVSVPTKKYNSFEEKCANFFKYWSPGTVLVNGGEPDKIFDDALKVDDNFYIINNASYRDEDVIVMGGVPYGVDQTISDNIVRSSRVVVFAELGEFSPVPSRESLRMTDSAKQKIDAYTEKFKESIVKQARLDIETAPTGTEAVLRYNRWSKTMYQNADWDESLQYNGHDIVGNVKHTHMVHEPTNWDQNRHVERVIPGKHTYAIQLGSKNYRQEGCEINPKVLYVVANPMPENITQHRKRQALALAREKMVHNTDRLYIVPELVMPWMDDVVSAKWEEVEKYKIYDNSDGSPRKQRVKVAGKYEVYNEGLVELEYDPYKKYVYTTDKKLFNNDISSGYKAPYSAMYLSQNDYVVIYLGKNRVNKFLQQFPTALELWVEFQRLRKEEYDNLDTELLGLLAYSQTHDYMLYNESFRGLSKVDDPTLKAFGESIVKYSREDINNAEGLVRQHDNTYRMYREDILEAYPLGHRSLTDVEVEIINALYYYRKEKV